MNILRCSLELKRISRIAKLLLLGALSVCLYSETFIAPISGNLYCKSVGGTAGAISVFGTGTSPTSFTPLIGGLPSRPNPEAEVFIRTVDAGEIVHFGIQTAWNNRTYWAFSNLTDQASIVAFSDTRNSLGQGGKIIENAGPSLWRLRLDDAASYLFDDNNNDILIQLRLVPSSAPPPSAVRATFDFEAPLPSSLRPAPSFLNGTAVPSESLVTNQYRSAGLLVSGAALAAFGINHASSGVNALAPVSASTNRIDYRAPITFSFVTVSGAPASTDYFSIYTDKAGGSGNTVLLSAFGPGGKAIASRSVSDRSGGQQIAIENVGHFETVTVQMIYGDPNTGGVGYDLVSIGPVESSESQRTRPTINDGGVVNAASYIPEGLPASGIAQGGLFVIFGRNLGPDAIVTADRYPLPTVSGLGGTSIRVVVGSAVVNAIMIYASGAQVAAVLPSATPVGAGTMILTHNGQDSASSPVNIVKSSFGIFTRNQSGTGYLISGDRSLRRGDGENSLDKLASIG